MSYLPMLRKVGKVVWIYTRNRINTTIIIVSREGHSLVISSLVNIHRSCDILQTDGHTDTHKK